jgi:RNA polymerase sigma-70 factor (ECF subfamily)
MSTCAGEHDLDNDLEERWLSLAAEGDANAATQLLSLHRHRLRQMIACRIDVRLNARIDVSDVLQEVLTAAITKLPAYARERPLPFYPWLRQIAWERLVKLRHYHLYTSKRAASREVSLPLPDSSTMELAERLLARGPTPSQNVVREEVRCRVQRAMNRLSARDQELLILRYLEQLSMAEVAAIMNVSEGAVKVRHLRALERLRKLLDSDLA